MSAEDFKKYSPTDPELIDKIVNNIKAQGLFDQFRKDCLADVDTKPAYQNLQQRVNGSVTGFLSSQKWQGSLNKTQLRESLRKHTVQQGFLEVGVDRIVDQVVNPKIFSVFTPKVEDVVYECLGIERPKPKPKPLLLDFQAFKKSLTPMNSVASKPAKTEKTQVPSISKEQPPEIKEEPEEAEEPVKDIKPVPVSDKPPEPTSTPPPLNDIDTSEQPLDLGTGTPPSVPGIVNNVNNDDDSNTIDEMPLIAASLDQDSNRATTPIINSVPQNDNKVEALSEASGSHSIIAARARSEYDSSTNNLSFKSEEKISPSKKFDNFSNLGEKLKQSDMNLRETSAPKNEIVAEESSELTKSSENDSESYEIKVDPPSESNMSSLDNTRYEPTRDEDIFADKMFSEDSHSSLLSSKSRSRNDEVKESRSREKHSEKKSSSSKSKDKPKSSGDRDGSVEKEGGNKKDRHKSAKLGDSKPKDDGKDRLKHDKDAKHKSDKHKPSKEKTSHSSDRHSKNDSEKERKEKKDRTEVEDKKADKRKHDSKVSENGRDSEKKRKDDDRSHHSKSHEKNDRKHEDKAKSEKEKKDKDKSKSEGKEKSKYESSSKSSHSKSTDKKSKDEKKGKDEDSKKDSKKRKREQCEEDDLKSKNPRRSSDRDSNGNPDGGSNKHKSSSLSHSSKKSSKGDKERKHSKKESNPSEAVEEQRSEELVTDEIDLIMMQINNSIEDEQQRINVRELLGETNVKKPKIARNFQEIKKVMQARKHIDKIISEVNVDRPNDDGNDEKPGSPVASEDEGTSKRSLPIEEQELNDENRNQDLNEGIGLRKFSVVMTDVLKNSSNCGSPSMKNKCFKLEGESAEKLASAVSIILGEDDEILRVDKNESGTSESGASACELKDSSVLAVSEMTDPSQVLGEVEKNEESISVNGGDLPGMDSDAGKNPEVRHSLTKSQISEYENLTTNEKADSAGSGDIKSSNSRTRRGTLKSEGSKDGQDGSAENNTRTSKSASRDSRAKSKIPELEGTVAKEEADSAGSRDASPKAKPSSSRDSLPASRTQSEGSKGEQAEFDGNDIRKAPNSPVPCRSSSRKNAGNRLYAILEEVGGVKFPTPTAERQKRRAPKADVTNDNSRDEKSRKGTEQDGLIDQNSAKIIPDDGSDVSNKENDEAKASGACKTNHQKSEELLPDASQVEQRSLRRKPVDSMMLRMNEDISKLRAPTTRPTTRRSAVTPLNLRNKELDDDSHRSKTLAAATPGSTELESAGVIADKFRVNEGVRKSMECLQMDKENTLTPMTLDTASAAQAQNIVSPTQRRKSCPDIFQRRSSQDQNESPSSDDESSQSGFAECPTKEKSRPKVGIKNRSDKPSVSNLVEESNAAPTGGRETPGRRGCSTRRSASLVDGKKLDGLRSGKKPKHGISTEPTPERTQKPSLRKNTSELVATKPKEADTVAEGIPEMSGGCQTGVNLECDSLPTVEKPESRRKVESEDEEKKVQFEYRTRGINKRRKSLVDEKKKSGSSSAQKNKVADVLENPTAVDESTSQQTIQMSSSCGRNVNVISTADSFSNRPTPGLDSSKGKVATEPRSSSIDSMMGDSDSVSELRGFSGDDFDDESDGECRGFSEEEIQKAVLQLRLLKNFIAHSSFAREPRCADVGEPRPKKTRVPSDGVPPTSADPRVAPRTSSRLPRKRKFSLHSSPDKDKKSDLVGQCKAESKDSGLCDSPEQPSFPSDVAQKMSTTQRPTSGNNGLRTRKVQGPMVNGDTPKASKQGSEKGKDEASSASQLKPQTIQHQQKPEIQIIISQGPIPHQSSPSSSQRYSASDLYKPRPSFTRDPKTTSSPRVTTVGRSKKST